MGIELLLAVVIVIGAVVAFRVGGEAGRRARRTLLIGFVCSIGGCVGALATLDAETSGARNALSGLHPFIYFALLLAGFFLMVAGAVLAIHSRGVQKRGASTD